MGQRLPSDAVNKREQRQQRRAAQYALWMKEKIEEEAENRPLFLSELQECSECGHIIDRLPCPTCGYKGDNDETVG